MSTMDLFVPGILYEASMASILELRWDGRYGSVAAVATGVRELTGGPCARFWSRVRDSLDGVEVSVVTKWWR